MIIRSLVLFLFSMLSVAAMATDGAIGSGGGKGVVCRDAKGAIQSVELLDLWEARILYKRSITPLGKTIAEQVHAALDALKGAVNIYDNFAVDANNKITYIDPGDKLVLESLSEVADQFGLFSNPASNVSILANVTLALTDDSYEVAKPSDCTIEQIVTYQDFGSSSEIWVSRDLVDRMDDTNKAALLAHEAFYSLLRNSRFDEANSIRARRAVGYVFSGKSFSNFASMLPTKRLHCFDNPGIPMNKNDFYLIQSGPDVVSLSSKVMGRVSVGFFLADTHLHGVTLEQLMTVNQCSDFGSTMIFNLGSAGPITPGIEEVVSRTCDNRSNDINWYIAKKTTGQNTLLHCNLEEN